MEKKVCNTCGIPKFLDHFPFDRGNRRKPKCKGCSNAIRRAQRTSQKTLKEKLVPQDNKQEAIRQAILYLIKHHRNEFDRLIHDSYAEKIKSEATWVTLSGHFSKNWDEYDIPKEI